MNKLPWTEKEFEDWLVLNSIQPAIGTIIVVDREEPIERMPDLLALDSDANLIIIEIKNENTTRTAIGQSLEYLSQFANITLEDIDNNYIGRAEQPLADKFRILFGKALTSLSQQRKVYLVAPSFDAASIICAEYLSEQFKQLRDPVQFTHLSAKFLCRF